MSTFALAIHGGCGVMAKLDLSEAEWKSARADLASALTAGWKLLADGGSALDAVEAAVVVMEDSPHFNAGRGAALTVDGRHEMDASIMDGRTLAAGAVAVVSRIRNPVKAARAVMEARDAVILAGSAAEDFARQRGLAMEDPSYFTTERRVGALASLKEKKLTGQILKASEAEKHGTVGAVALDSRGHLAAATSTGGYNNKPAGRIGDSPIIGAGNYACDGICAVSGTGAGEVFIRHCAAHEVASRMAYLKESLHAATAKVVMEDLSAHNIGAGMIAIDAAGRVAAPFNTEGMFRGWVTTEGDLHVATHAEVLFVGRLGPGT